MKRNCGCFVFILLFVCSTLNSQTFLLSSMGARLGSVLPNMERQNLFSVGVQSRLIGPNPKWRLSPFFEYAVGDTKISQNTTNHRIFSLGASAVTAFDLTYSKVYPYVGGGAGMSYIRSEASTPNAEINKEFDLTLHVVAGLELPLQPNMLGRIELKYVLAGRMDYLGAWAGFSYVFTTE